MYRNEYELTGYPVALNGEDHSAVLRFLLTELLKTTGQLASLSDPEGSPIQRREAIDGLLGGSSAPGSLERLKQLSLLYHPPRPEFKELVDQLRSAIDETRVEALRYTTGAPLDSLSEAHQQAALSVQHLFSAYLEDENLLLFLVRQAAPLDKIYGAPVVRQLLDSGFGSLAKARTFLEERYRRRGFHHVAAAIDQCMAQLEPGRA